MNHSHILSLFKYKKIDSNLLNALSKNMIYAPIATQLNDPFESHINIKKQRISNKNLSDFYENLYSSLKTGYFKSSISLNEIKDIIYNNDFDINRIIKDKEEINIANIINKILLSYGIVSFTVNNTSLLMWSHYGDSHKGVCIEYSRNENNALANPTSCFPVNYSSFIKEIDNFSIENISEIFKLKSDVWSYEKEWRYISKDGKCMIPAPGIVKGIYFGLNTSEKDIDSIFSILGRDIKYYKAIKHENMYKIDYEVLIF